MGLCCECKRNTDNSAIVRNEDNVYLCDKCFEIVTDQILKDGRVSMIDNTEQVKVKSEPPVEDDPPFYNEL